MASTRWGTEETDSEDEIDVENVAEDEDDEEEEEDGRTAEVMVPVTSRTAGTRRKRTAAAAEGNGKKEDADGVSPLDALLQMTSKAFDGRQDAKNQGE